MATFDAELSLDGATATGIAVPEDVVEALGGGGRIPVTVTIGSVTYPSTIARMKGVAKIPVSADIRSRAGVAAGQLLTVTVEHDDAPRTVEVPQELRALLDEHPDAAAAFAALSPSNQKRHVLAVTSAKTDETRQRRLAAILAELQR
ncbi:YdeI/OmpD-associated family protein [Humibacter sp.]|jgi:hypothetical protein|uniref:YdeI/OmpD-associated family protein n=1 Tax=Humibacter sp. TaxID=1940291 RepID=UPI002BC50A07|nr:YdeI/OmpD-associated family protein [Humibacter sp.]HVX08379.1 YdeI/OmpD-associated family protein [Humibacter sp.]